MKLCSLVGAAELAHFGGESLLGQLRHRRGRVERLGHFAFALDVVDVDVLGELFAADVTGFDFHAFFEHFDVQLWKGDELESLDDIGKASEVFRKLWKSSGSFGSLQEALEVFRKLWKSSGSFGSLQEALEVFKKP
jgi:hypothetical protein